MNTVRPRPYPQRGTGNYNAGNEGTDKDGRNQNGQERQQQGQKSQVVARGRVSDVQQQAPIQNRAEIYSPANNAYPQRQVYPVHTPPPMRINQPIHQVNPQQYQTLQSGYQPIGQPAEPVAPRQNQRSNKVNIAQILKDFRNTIKAIATPPEIEENVKCFLDKLNA